MATQEEVSLVEKAKSIFDPASEFAKLPFPEDIIEKVRTLHRKN